MRHASAKLAALTCAIALAFLLGACSNGEAPRNQAADPLAERGSKAARRIAPRTAAARGGRSSAFLGEGGGSSGVVRPQPPLPPGATGSTVGITATTIKLGFVIVSNNDKLLSNYGVRGGAIGDTRQQVDAVVNDFNARGGINGRKIVPAVRMWNSTGDASQYEAMCTGFTRDDKAHAFVPSIGEAGRSRDTLGAARRRGSGGR